jgi:molybdate transport system substrate-binding protein
MNKAQAFIWLLAIVPLLQSGRPPQHQKVLVAAAADLRYAMDALVASYKEAHPGSDVQVVYGSSGNFYEQIRSGAPFDLFFSADRNYPDQLAAQGKVIGAVTDYGIGRLVLWSLHLDPTIQGIRTLEDPTVSRIAIANPDHAPYGKRAVESLHYYGIYDKVSPKLVFGENIAQTAQFAMSGSADAGIIALALALSPPMQQTGGKYWVIPDDSHGRLEQGYVLLPHARGNGDALDFQAFIRSATAQSILNRFGFNP